jgi:hypothetical protein
MNDRVRAEIDLLRKKFPALEHGEKLNWVLIPAYPLPPGRFNQNQTRLLFAIPLGYPNTGPDNFFVDVILRLKDGGNPLAFNANSNSSTGAVPILGDWGWFSWHPQSWRPSASIEGGDNLMTFLRGVSLCLRGEESA